MTAKPLPYNLPVSTTPFDSNASNITVPIRGNGYIIHDVIPSAEHNYLFNAVTANIGLAQTLGLFLPFNPNSTGLSQVACPMGGIVTLADNTSGATRFFQATQNHPAGFTDPSTGGAGWQEIAFSTLATNLNSLIASYAPKVGFIMGDGSANGVQFPSYPSVLYTWETLYYSNRIFSIQRNEVTNIFALASTSDIKATPICFPPVTIVITNAVGQTVTPELGTVIDVPYFGSLICVADNTAGIPSINKGSPYFVNCNSPSFTLINWNNNGIGGGYYDQIYNRNVAVIDGNHPTYFYALGGGAPYAYSPIHSWYRWSEAAHIYDNGSPPKNVFRPHQQYPGESGGSIDLDLYNFTLSVNGATGSWWKSRGYIQMQMPDLGGGTSSFIPSLKIY